jgi:hypothetical protein
MKPMTLNLSKMKKIAGDKKSSTFLHNDGHQIIIAHSALPALQRKQVEKLPIHIQKFALGGVGISDGPGNPDALREAALRSQMSNQLSQPSPNDSPDSPPLTPDQANQLASRRAQAQINQEPVDANNNLNQQDSMQAEQDRIQRDAGAQVPDKYFPSANAPTSDNSPSKDLPNMGAPVQPVASGSSSSPSSSLDVMGAYDQGQRSIDEQQRIESAKSQANAKIQGDDVQARQDLLTGLQQNQKDFTDHQQKFMQDYMNNHIDPNHYQENMGTSQKVATAVGLLFGGFSQGISGGSNPAADWLNKQIDRDIDAQRSRMDQQKTLLGANENLFHDQVLVNNATRVNMNDIYDHQIQLAASKLGTPQAQATADAMHSKFALENANLINQNALRATVLHSAGANGGQGLDAIDLAHAGLMNPEQAAKEQSSINAQKTAVDGARNIFKRYDQEQTTGNLLNGESSRRVNAINAELTNLIMSVDASKRLTPESAKLEVKPFWVNTTDDNSVRQNKLQGVLNLIKNHSEGSTPNMTKYAPNSLPNYSIASNQPQQYRVGDIVNIKGQGKVQIINAKGDYKPVN